MPDFPHLIEAAGRIVDATGVAVLAAIVLIRTFLSWSLELEITGRWPWQKEREPETQEPSPAE